MQTFDASSMIYAWDNYPIGQFPTLWEWMAQRVQAGLIQLPEIALDEVGHKVPECVAWLKANQVQIIPVSEAILQEALRIKGLLGIEEDWHPKGVDENDLIIIATAKLRDIELVSNEEVQNDLPVQKRKYKIPAVCRMATVKIPQIDFLGYLKRTKTVF